MIKKWPLHPKPYEYQLLYSWIEKLAEAYGVSYQNFCKNVLELEPHEISSLRSSLPERAIVILAHGTGIPAADLSKRDLRSTFERLKQELAKAMEENPDDFASLLQQWGIKP